MPGEWFHDDNVGTLYSKFQIVSGMFGTPARCWVSRGKPFQVDPNVQSPWASNLIGGSALYSAQLIAYSARAVANPISSNWRLASNANSLT